MSEVNIVMMENKYALTIKAAYLGYVVQAVVNNFVPLLFIRFQSEFGIPLGKITLLITFNFGIQLLIDTFSTPFIEKIGYKASMIISNAAAAAGFFLLTVLPGRALSPFAGILVSVCVYAVGGGLQEVLVSPIVEGCPSKNKQTQMSLLHSAYCWGHMAVVLLSTLFFAFFNISSWRILALLWCIVPLTDLILFIKVPVNKPEPDSGKSEGLRGLLSQGIFWLIFLMMLCAGASEQAISQWTSAFAEKGLGVSKTLGDIFGPMMFALCMGISRTIYGFKGEKIKLHTFMSFSTALCLVSYAVIVFVPNPVIALLGCGIAGFSVGIFWPGTFSTASQSIKGRGTLMFALLALAGDIGCAAGPTLAGSVAGAFGDNMRIGILAALVFPLIMGAGLIVLKNKIKIPK